MSHTNVSGFITEGNARAIYGMLYIWSHIHFTENKTFSTALGCVTLQWYPKLATGQAIMERAHATLKHKLEKQKGGVCGETPTE